MKKDHYSKFYWEWLRDAVTEEYADKEYDVLDICGYNGFRIRNWNQVSTAPANFKSKLLKDMTLAICFAI